MIKIDFALIIILHSYIPHNKAMHRSLKQPKGNHEMSQVTKRALEASFKRIMQNKPFEKITIKDITDDCGVNRMTFYYHFKDIYDLLEWICYEDGKRILEEHHAYDTWQEGFYQIFEEVRKNKVLVDNIYHALGKELIENYIYPLVRDLIMRVLHEQEGGVKLADEAETFIADYYTFVFIGFMFQWVKGDMKTDPHQIIENLSKLIEGTMEETIRRFRKSEA